MLFRWSVNYLFYIVVHWILVHRHIHQICHHRCLHYNTKDNQIYNLYPICQMDMLKKNKMIASVGVGPSMVVQPQKIDFCCFNDFNYFIVCCNACILKSSLMYGCSWDVLGRFINFRFNTICNITQEPQELSDTTVHVYRFVGKSAVIKYRQLISKVTGVNSKSLVDQLATASSSKD